MFNTSLKYSLLVQQANCSTYSYKSFQNKTTRLHDYNQARPGYSVMRHKMLVYSSKIYLILLKDK